MRRLVPIALIVVGLGFVIIGLLAGLFYLGLPVVSPDAQFDLLQINTVAVSVLAVSGLAGAIMAGRDLSTRRVPAGGLQEKLTIDDRDEFQPARPTGIRGPVSADRGRPALRPPLPLLRAYRRRMFARDG